MSAKLRKGTTSFIMSGRQSVPWHNSVPTARIFMKFDIWGFFENLSRKFRFDWNRTRILGTLREDQYTFFLNLIALFSSSNEEFSDKICRENQNTHFVFSNFFKHFPWMRKCGKIFGAGQPTDDNMVHAHCMLDT